MQARPLTIAVVLLSLAFSFSPVHGEPPGNPAVAVVPNISDLSNIDRAIFSPDGSQVATLDSARGIKLWDISSGRLLRTLQYETYFNAAVFSPDGRWIISAHKDGAIKLWDAATGAMAATLQTKSNPDYEDSVASLWIDAKGAMLVSGSDSGAVAVWDLEKRRQLRSFAFGKVPEGINAHVIAVRLTADRARIVAVTLSTVKVFDAGTGKEISAFDLPNQYPWWNSKERTSFSRDSIVSDDGLIVLYSGPACEVEELKFLSLKDTGNLASIDKPASCDRPEDKGSLGEPAIFTSQRQSGVIIARNGMPELKQWDIPTRQVTRTIKWPGETGAELTGVDRDFKLAASQKADNVLVRQFENGAKVRELLNTAYSAETAAISRDGRFVLLSHDPARPGSGKKDVTLWQLGTLEPNIVQVATEADTFIRDFAPGAKLALAVNSKNEIVVFSTETGQEQRRFSVAGVKDVYRTRLSPDGKLIALTGEDDNEKAVAVLVDAGDGKVKHRFAGRDERNGMMASIGSDDESDHVTALAFSPDSRSVAVGRWNGTAEIWDTQKLRRVRALPASKKDADQAWSLAFSADGRKLVSGSRNSGVFVWETDSARAPRAFLYEAMAGHAHFESVAVSHDGKLVAGGLGMHAVSSGDTGPEHGIKVWNAATGKLRLTLRGHDGGIGGLGFSPDDRWIVSASYDGTVRYWSSATGQWAATFTAARDGRWLITTEGGPFAGTVNSDDFIGVVRGLKSLPASPFRGQLYRPDLVETFLKGDPDRRYPAAVKQLNLDKAWDSKN